MTYTNVIKNEMPLSIVGRRASEGSERWGYYNGFSVEPETLITMFPK